MEIKTPEASKPPRLISRESYELAFGVSLLSFPEEAIEAAQILNPIHIRNGNVAGLYDKILRGEPYVEESHALRLQASDVLLNSQTRRYRPKELAKKVYDYWMRDIFLSRMAGIIGEANQVLFETTLQRSQAVLSEILSSVLEEAPADAFSVWERMLKHAVEFKEIAGRGFQTGIRVIDEIVAGLFPKHLWVVGGAPGSGKSTFVLWIVSKLLRQGKKVVIFSLENDQEDVLARLASLELSIPFLAIKTGNLSEEEREAVQKFGEQVKQLPLHVYDNISDIHKIFSKTKFHAMKNECDIVAVDYLQLVRSLDDREKYIQMVTVMQELRRMANELNVSVIGASQLSIQEKREKGEAKSSMKGAGEITEVANVAIWIEQTKDNKLKVFFNKVRHAQSGRSTELRFYDPTAASYIEPIV